jgi:benzoyl-CoA reductase/2-hydroxyglutaryl-CoA dehydratase subunit BcrC/BadD/HgdB
MNISLDMQTDLLVARTMLRKTMEEKVQVKTTAVKGTDMARKVRGLVKNLYQSAHEAKAQANSGNPYVERLLGMIDDYKIDGVVFHACRSCRANTIGQVHRKNILSRYTDIPMMQLVSDMVDLRDYSEAQWKAQISTFMEALSGRTK